MTKLRTRADELAAIRKSMMDHLRAALSPEVASKLSGPTVREILSVLAEWAYGEQHKVREKQAKETAKQSPTARLAQERQDAVREALKKPLQQSVFLDAIDEIG